MEQVTRSHGNTRNNWKLRPSSGCRQLETRSALPARGRRNRACTDRDMRCPRRSRPASGSAPCGNSGNSRRARSSGPYFVDPVHQHEHVHALDVDVHQRADPEIDRAGTDPFRRAHHARRDVVADSHRGMHAVQDRAEPATDFAYDPGRSSVDLARNDDAIGRRLVGVPRCREPVQFRQQGKPWRGPSRCAMRAPGPLRASAAKFAASSRAQSTCQEPLPNQRRHAADSLPSVPSRPVIAAIPRTPSMPNAAWPACQVPLRPAAMRAADRTSNAAASSSRKRLWWWRGHANRSRRGHRERDAEIGEVHGHEPEAGGLQPGVRQQQ